MQAQAIKYPHNLESLDQVSPGRGLAASIGESADFFVDEDKAELIKFLIEPIIADAQAPANAEILVPMRHDIAKFIATRVSPILKGLIKPPVHLK